MDSIVEPCQRDPLLGQTAEAPASAGPRFDLDGFVVRKFFGTGQIYERRPASSGFHYHVRLADQRTAWLPESDLRAATADEVAAFRAALEPAED